MITQRPKGTQDWYGSEMHKRTIIEDIARKICRTYNVKEIITPVLSILYCFRGVGETTDVVRRRCIPSWTRATEASPLNRRDRRRSLAYLENSLFARSQPIKLFYITPVFRYENPQSGRLRQHHQFGVEFFGSAKPSAEVEIISIE